MATHNLPPLPRIEGDVDLTLSIYTHSSLAGNRATDPSLYDSDRLVEMGDQVLNLVATNYLFSKQPLLNASDIRSQRSSMLEESKMNIWLEAYDLKSKLRYTGEYNVLEDRQEMKKYFLSYVGGVFVNSGMPIVENWIAQLIDPSFVPSDTTSYAATSSAQPPTYYPPTPAPPPPAHPPPPLPSVDSLTWLTLATVNQTASQKHVTIEYKADNPVGPSHAPFWTVRCLMDGQERGVGTGKSQKLAKEQAARQAYINMGW